jgi:mRNA-degrading endonuclease RelE of RelBE toxin-antitoxin system
LFEIFLTKTFASELKKLQKHEISRIKKKLISCSKKPFLFFERLQGTKLFKLRIGKFRVLASVNSIDRKITCLSVALRKKIYKRLK